MPAGAVIGLVIGAVDLEQRVAVELGPGEEIIGNGSADALDLEFL